MWKTDLNHMPPARQSLPVPVQRPTLPFSLIWSCVIGIFNQHLETARKPSAHLIQGQTHSFLSRLSGTRQGKQNKNQKLDKIRYKKHEGSQCHPNRHHHSRCFHLQGKRRTPDCSPPPPTHPSAHLVSHLLSLFVVYSSLPVQAT